MKNNEMLNDEVLENVSGGISQDEALAAALKHAGLSRNQVDFVKEVEPDWEHGRKVFEIKFYQGNMEYEYEVDADTGRILKADKDWD